jgi:hypothetical protein
MLLTPDDVRRRSFGTLFLVLAVTLLIWGQTLLKPHLTGVAFIFYWLACFGAIGLTIGIALWDLRVMRVRWRRHQEELVKRTMLELELKKKAGLSPPSATHPGRSQTDK